MVIAHLGARPDPGDHRTAWDDAVSRLAVHHQHWGIDPAEGADLPGRSVSDSEYTHHSPTQSTTRRCGSKRPARVQHTGCAEPRPHRTRHRNRVGRVAKHSGDAPRSCLPLVAGALPLVLARSRIEDVDDAGVTIGVGDPTVAHTWIPVCGCDACDSGSQDALDEPDECVLGIVAGQFRRLPRGTQAITVISGSIRQSSGINGRGARRALADPAGWDELTGSSWISRGR